MRYAIVFSSKTGNTKLLADTLHDSLPQDACSYFGAPDPAALDADTLYVGFWTDKGTADAAILQFLEQLHGKKVFLFGTAGFGADQAYFSQIIRRLEGELPQNCTVIGWYMCPGRMGEGVRRRYEAMLQDPVSAGQAELLLKNFDAVRTRPDERDAQALLAAAGL